MKSFTKPFTRIQRYLEWSGDSIVSCNHLKKLGLEVHRGIGGHGVAGILTNGDGKTILMRAELHALPIFE